ncbi:MAG: hypothetical protein PHO57_11705 [Acidithiobacillus sp.]|nr:hypothetical protein [Acidithiobacillus sp.]
MGTEPQLTQDQVGHDEEVLVSAVDKGFGQCWMSGVAMRLFIAETPSLGKGIAKYLPGSQLCRDGCVQCGQDTVK